MRELTIDPEFRDKVPPMTEAEYRQLEENILKAGRVKVPITIWNDNGKETIVDGHNRWSIVQKHPEIPYEVEEEHFADRYEAVVWICKNQLGRRNLTDAQKTYLIGRQYEAQKMTKGAPQGNSNAKKQLAQNGPFVKGDTAETIAKEHNIGRNTVKRAEKFVKGVDAAEKIECGVKDAILSGKSKVPKTVIAGIPKMPPQEQREVITVAKTGGAWPPKKEATGSKIGYPAERRQINAVIKGAVADLQNTERTIEHTIDDLLEDLNAIITDFQGKARRSISNHSTLLQDETSKKKVIAALSEAETAIEKMKGLLL
jgi:hypothetical protein